MRNIETTAGILAMLLICSSSVTALEEEKGCLDCHEDIVEQFEGELAHQPFADGECNSCHRYHGFVPRIVLKCDVTHICTGCHAVIGDLPEERIHTPLADSESCTLCHDPHRADHENLLTLPREEICMQCHDGPADMEGELHPPYADGLCIDCHDPHGTLFSSHLIMPAGYVCLTCHEDVLEGYSPDAMHSSDEISSCENCHGGHASEHGALLKTSGTELCAGCHDGIASLIEEGTAHTAVADGECLDCHRPHFRRGSPVVDDPLPGFCIGCHDEIGERLALAVPHEAAEDCVLCHDPHRRLAAGDVVALCAECHDLEDDDFLDLHDDPPPADCAECHDPHGSDEGRLLR